MIGGKCSTCAYHEKQTINDDDDDDDLSFHRFPRLASVQLHLDRSRYVFKLSFLLLPESAPFASFVVVFRRNSSMDVSALYYRSYQMLSFVVVIVCNEVSLTN